MLLLVDLLLFLTDERIYDEEEVLRSFSYVSCKNTAS